MGYGKQPRTCTWWRTGASVINDYHPKREFPKISVWRTMQGNMARDGRGSANEGARRRRLGRRRATRARRENQDQPGERVGCYLSSLHLSRLPSQKSWGSSVRHHAHVHVHDGQRSIAGLLATEKLPTKLSFMRCADTSMQESWCDLFSSVFAN